MRPIHWLRLTSILEGISLVALVFVAMPLKYFAAMPVAVRVGGSVHGFFFLVFAAALFQVAMARRWPLARSLQALGASVLPFGAFVLARWLRDDDA